jgi:hypothetical protein
MPNTRIFTNQWDNIISDRKTIAHGLMKPGNFYKVIVYKYAADGKTRTLTGLSTSYIFLLGKYVDKQVRFPAIKLKHVNPEQFFTAIKILMGPVNEEKLNEIEEFRFLLRKYQLDGAPIFNVLKTKPLIYEGNYREYKMTSIKSVEILNIDKEYLRDKFLPSSNPSQKEKERRENLKDSNTSKKEVEPPKNLRDSKSSKKDAETPKNLSE